MKDFLNLVRIYHLCSLVFFLLLSQLISLGSFFYSMNVFGAVNHLDYLGVQVAWISAPWFLSIFMNMIPWESGKIFFGVIF